MMKRNYGTAYIESKYSMKVALTFLILAVFCTPLISFSEDKLGRLFFTPEKRATLERQRELKVVESTPTVTSGTMTVNGYVKRSNGNNTTWINGVAQNNKDVMQSVKVMEGRSSAEVVVIPSTGEKPVVLKVGETLDKNKRTINRTIEKDQIKIHDQTKKQSPK